LKNSAGRSGILAGAASAIVLLRILVALLATAQISALADEKAPGNVPRSDPRLASLQVEIWPEFDRPATALVILRGEIAADVPLPATVGLRIPAESGGPTAVAYSAEPGGVSFNLKYDRRDASDFIALEFSSPKRFFQVEFYDPIDTTAAVRSYTYVWAGELATSRLIVVLQEPAAASDILIEPSLGATAVGQDELRYRSADLGPFPLGKPLRVALRYAKTDSRTSAEIRKPQAASSSTTPIEGPSKKELAVWLVAIVTVLALGAIAISKWMFGRKGASKPRAREAGNCGKCGAPSAPGDSFCSKCGARLA